MDEDADQMRQEIQEHLSAVILEQIVVGEVGHRNLPQICWSFCFWAGVMGSVLSTVAIWIFEP